MDKYSDKFLNQHKKLSYCVIGFELEFYLKEFSYYKTLEMLNKELSPVRVHGFRQYHSSFKPNASNFKIEPDLSGGSNMVELVTGPMPYHTAKFYLIKILKFISNYGYTNDKCSIHFNVSFDSDRKDLNDLNVLKLILNTDEEEIYKYYPSRENNVYSKSVKNIIPFRDYDFFNVPITVVRNNIKIPDDKYFGINFLNIIENKEDQRVEYRYIGGKDYHKDSGRLLYFLDKFIVNVYDAIGSSFNRYDIDMLEEFLTDNISKFKNFSVYDKFLVDYPRIQIQIDQISTYEVVSSYYNVIYPKLFKLINGSEQVGECIVNYDTSRQRLEIVNSKLVGIQTISDLDLISCDIEGIFEKCHLISCEVNNSQLKKCKINNTELTEAKLYSCSVDNSDLNDCFVMGGNFNGNMYGGVFRSGELGPEAYFDSKVKIVTDKNNFFDTSYDNEESSSKSSMKDKLKTFRK
jgi:hypothetical protein